jgi:Fur family transcriptional regulator, ferric uptake regulator
MPYSPHVRRLAFADIAEVAAAVRENGGRLSSSRRAVLEALFAADGPVAADYIADGCDGTAAPLDRVSVYRSLEHLEQLGVVQHVHLGHGPGLYALTGTGEREYLVCERCDRVTAVDPSLLDPVRDQIRKAFGYRARFSHFPIIGLCARCADQEGCGPAKARKARRGDAMSEKEHGHDHPHRHEHSHGDVEHDHPHTEHDHEHTEHEHEHSHGDHAHSHPHVHEKGVEDDHEHSH